MALPSLFYSDFLASMMPRLDKKKSQPIDPRTVADEEKKRDQDQPFREQMKGREVLLRREAGDLLGAQEQMQDPNYQLGSGSSLRKTPQPLAPDWTRMNRASRRLRRKGFASEAAKMASMAELERLGTPNIATQEQRNRMDFMDMERDAKEYDKKKSEDLYDQYMLKRRQKRMESANTTSI